MNINQHQTRHKTACYRHPHNGTPGEIRTCPHGKHQVLTAHRYGPGLYYIWRTINPITQPRTWLHVRKTIKQAA